jgi:hypothetical protein
MFCVRRREFITLLGGAAAALLDSRLPLEAQQANKIYRLGVLSPSSASVDSIRAVTVPELAKAGFIEGQNLVIDARAGSGSQIPELARALVASNLDAIIAVSDISIEAAKAARPGGNITGVVMLAPELNAKRLTLLHEAMPKARRIAALAVSEHRYETILRASTPSRREPDSNCRHFLPRRQPPIRPRSRPCSRRVRRPFSLFRRPSSLETPKFLQHWPSRQGCRPYASGATWRRRAAYSATALARPSCVVVPRTISCASFAGARPATCRLRGRHDSSSRSI